jgi:hypothetical protein
MRLVFTSKMNSVMIVSMSSLLLIFTTLAALLLTPVGFAQELIQNKKPNLIDRSHEQLSYNLVRLADRVDSFFGETRADDELNRSSLRVTYDYRLVMEGKPISDTQIRVNIRLPKLEEKLKFSVERNDKEKEIVTIPKADHAIGTLPTRTKEEIDKEPWRFRFDSGINATIPPSIFARARLRKNWNFPMFIQRFTHELTWSSFSGWTQTSTLFFDKSLSSVSLFRFINTQNWSITRKDFFTSHGPSILHTITENDAISYSASMQTLVNDSWYVSNYQLGIAYRRNLRNQWLYGEIGPAIDFPKIASFRRSPSVLLRIESLFAQN